MSLQYLSILGSTGSIGENTLDVISLHPDKFAVFALAAHSSVDKMLQQIIRFEPTFAVMVCSRAAKELLQKLKHSELKTEVLSGEQALIDIAKATEVDCVVAGIVGAAGMPSTLAAVRSGKRVLLANKESLVIAGSLLMDAVNENCAQLLPVDSEHNAIFQCLPSPCTSLESAGIRRLLLTGSGGPFRKLNLSEFNQITPEQACDHPNWSMGRKISVDSATMMNKGLEYIEAKWLFSAAPAQLDVVVHPQSIIHSMVEYNDGSVLAQMGQPDMRTPIAHCLGWPERIESGVSRLNFFELANLEFEKPDFERFPCLKFAIDAANAGGTYAAALNACNEVAVSAFLQETIKFTQISQLVEQILGSWDSAEPNALEDVLHADQEARRRSQALISQF